MSRCCLGLAEGSCRGIYKGEQCKRRLLACDAHLVLEQVACDAHLVLRRTHVILISFGGRSHVTVEVKVAIGWHVTSGMVPDALK